MKILMVEDDRQIAEFVDRLLAHYNYAVDIAADGAAGLAMAEAFAYDLIISDIGLPKLDGVELCKRLRDRHFDNPILLLTGCEGSENKAIALNAGADDYVVKPFDSVELIARVQALLRRPAQGSQPILTWGNLAFDPTTRQVSYGDRPLKLTPKEYAILELLLRNWRSALSSRAILDRAWTADESPANEVVRAHIKELRHKFITVGAPKDLIKTIHRVGYQLNPAYAEPAIAGASMPNNEISALRSQLQAVRAQLAATQAELDRRNLEPEMRKEASAAKYHTLFETIDEGFILCEVIFDDRHHPIDILYLDANAAAVRMTGQELVGRHTSDLSPTFEAEWFTTLGRVALTGESIRSELPALPLNAWYEFYAFRPDPANTRQIALIYKDITDRKRAELQLQQQFQQECLLADIAQDIRQTLDLDRVLSSTVERVRAFLETDRVVIFHFRPDWEGEIVAESVGVRWMPLLGKRIADPCFGDTLIESYRQGRMSAIEDIDSTSIATCHVELLRSFQVKANLVVPILRGDRLWGLLIAHHCTAARQWQSQEITLLQRLATHVGIASQQSQLFADLQTQLAERELVEQKIQEQAALLDIATDAIFVRDLDHRILYWNRGAERLYGWTAAEAVGQKANELLGENPAKVAENIQAVLDLGEWRGEIRKVNRAGVEVIVEGCWTLERDENGQPKFILCVNTDITAKKSFEAQFYRAQRLESLGTLASGIAHDLNNVLTPILAFAQILRSQPSIDQKTQGRLQIIEDSARRGADMVEQILTFARGAITQSSVFRVDRMLEETIEVVRQTFPKSIVILTGSATAIDRHLPKNLWQVAGDTTQLQQVFLNLCVNARDAMPHGGTLTIDAANYVVDEMFARLNLNVRAGNYVLVTIADTGTGIPPEIIDRIFDPFFTTKPLGEGTGLGLATALGIINNHGGFVRVASVLGEGTEFKIYLPAATEGETPKTQSTAELVNGSGELILVVDDDPAVCAVNRSLLEEHHYRTLSASDGIEAMAIYAQQIGSIDLVLIDAMMPNLGGAAAIRAMHQMNPHVKIVAISGLSSNQAPMIESGARVFLAKPYQLADLLRMIAELLNS
jgi:PAS domain S-box-containing protein